MNDKEYLKIIEKFKEENKEDYESGNIRKIFLECLPIGGLNRGKRINWTLTEGICIYFIYADIEGWIKISKYIKKNKIKIIYNDKEENISTNDMMKCSVGRIIGKVTSEFKIEIGTRFQDKKRDITIIDREIRLKDKIDKLGRKSILKDKWYKYHCNIDGHENWIVESNIFKGHGCCLCFNQTVVEGINDIPTTAPWMVKYFQGGYKEAKLYTKTSSQSINPICPDCGRVKNQSIKIYGIYQTRSVGCFCSDKTSFGEKLMFNMFEQLGLNFQTQLTKANLKWCDNYKYDFAFKLSDEQCIVEAHGMQHYKDNTNFKRSLKKEQENDKLKKELALQNGIKEENYIVIDCRYSELDFIKENILNNEKMKNKFDLSKIDWNKCYKFALSNRIKEACEIKKANPSLNIKELSKIMKLNRNTITRYLKIGAELSWYNYDISNERRLGNKSKQLFSKSIICLNTLHIFESASECARQSINVFEKSMNFSSICSVCRGDKELYKGYKFKYIKDLTEDEYIRYDIKNKLKELNKAI